MHQGIIRRAKGSSTSPDVRSHRESGRLLSREGTERSRFLGSGILPLITSALIWFEERNSQITVPISRVCPVYTLWARIGTAMKTC